MLLLLESDSSVPDKNACALHAALLRGSEKVLKILAEQKLSPEIVDRHSWSAFHCARVTGKQDFLLKYFPGYDVVSLEQLPNKRCQSLELSDEEIEGMHMSTTNIDVKGILPKPDMKSC